MDGAPQGESPDLVLVEGAGAKPWGNASFAGYKLVMSENCSLLMKNSPLLVGFMVVPIASITGAKLARGPESSVGAVPPMSLQEVLLGTDCKDPNLNLSNSCIKSEDQE